jgi:hypothetical protein
LPDTPGQLLQTNPLIQVNDPNGLFATDELTRVHAAVDAVVEACGGWVTERSHGTAANGSAPSTRNGSRF